MAKHEIQGVVQFQSAEPGPVVVVSGGVHGDEPCGVSAVERLEREFESGRLQLLRGTLLLVTANLDALACDQRLVERNLNRLFKDNSAEPDCAEVRRAELLKPIFANCNYLLDLHSTSSPSPPFLMCEKDGLEIARHLDLDRVVLGWQALGEQVLSGDTECWARSHGATAFTLECGQHREPAAPQLAYDTALRFLRFVGAIAQGTVPSPKTPLVLWLYRTQLLMHPDFSFSRTYTGFDAVAEGEVIGRDSLLEYRADRDSYIIMPVPPALSAVGKELFMLAEPYTETLAS